MAEMGAASIVDLAKGADLFKGFPPSEVESLLYRFNGVKKSFAKDDTVALAGLEAKRMFVVVSGRLRVYEKTARGHQIFVREICAGEVLGLWILFTPEITCWPGTVVAAEPSVLISLDMAVVRRMMDTAAPEVARFSANVYFLCSLQRIALFFDQIINGFENIYIGFGIITCPLFVSIRI